MTIRAMKQTEQTLLEQMRITEFEFEHRKALFGLTQEDFRLLRGHRGVIEARIDDLVARFYRAQTEVAEIALLIGDADTLRRLSNAQRRYVLDLFSGVYDLEYVNNRLRIGLVHKRIGVEPKLYLSAVNTLKSLLVEIIRETAEDERTQRGLIGAIEKLMLFDITLVFETYIRSLVSEIEISKQKSENYARSLEEKVRERTRQLEEMARVDPLTGLLNVRLLHETVMLSLRGAQRRGQPLCLIYADVNDFKQINDSEGHQRGDEILKSVGDVIRRVSRAEDACFRCGGDEFCMVLPDCTEQQAREMYAARLQRELQRVSPGTTLSIGIVQTGPEDYLDAEALIRGADQRMYIEKKQHKAAPAALAVRMRAN
jgi:diguanylate cyclase